MKKNYYPLVGVGGLMVLGLLWWVFQGAPAEAPVPESPTSQTPTLPALPAIQEPSPSQGASGITVVEQTILRTFNHPKWHLIVSMPSEWEFATTREADGDISAVSFSSSEGNVYVSREDPIAEPSLVSFTTSTRTVAGQSVEVRRYANPNETYASYLYFTLEYGNYQYYVSVRSIDPTDAFISDVLEGLTSK